MWVCRGVGGGHDRSVHGRRAAAAKRAVKLRNPVSGARLSWDETAKDELRCPGRSDPR